jgi:hypothetical protein
VRFPNDLDMQNAEIQRKQEYTALCIFLELTFKMKNGLQGESSKLTLAD